MVESIMVIGRKTKCTGMEFSSGLMAGYIEVTTKKIKSMEKDLSPGQMENVMMETGMKGSNMDMELLVFQQERSGKGIGKMGRECDGRNKRFNSSYIYNFTLSILEINLIKFRLLEIQFDKMHRAEVVGSKVLSRRWKQ
jgi:hypothetical protein